LLGPVRSCAFHATQPLFVSAGDDGIVKVFNYRQRKLLFSLTGHLDYIRSVSFHHEAPWIVSASDDQTVRIWNWQSRQCVAVLSGHNHYVMCAAFHPTEDLLVSASLDQTIRVWDLTNIRAKAAPSPTLRKGSLSNTSNNNNSSSPPQIELFAGSGLDTSVKFILEGHDRGVNWVQFHPTRPLIVSGSDDRTVKIWRFNDIRAWEIDTFRGHMNNVSSVIWHPRSDFILSNSEDRTLRIWDSSSSTSNSSHHSAAGKCAMSVKRENDRFWCIAAHPEMNIFAAGHDNGLIVFKMNRERPAYTLTPDPVNKGDCLYYVKDKLVRSFALDAGTDSDEFVAPLERALKLPASVNFSPTERALLISPSGTAGGSIAIQLRDDKGSPITFQGSFGTFVGRSRFVSLQGSSQIILHNLTTPDEAKELPSPPEPILRLLPGPLGAFLAVSAGTVFLLDGTSGRIISSCDASGVKYVSWSTNYEHLALMAKRTIYLSDRSFKNVQVTHVDSTGVKSGAWDTSNPLGAIFYYTNSFHLKYLLPQGDSGIICTTSTPLYLVRVQGDLVHVIDRSASVLVLGIDPTECHFKLALNRGDSKQIEHLIANSNLVGQALIAYLREKGHAAIALQFVKDPGSRFDLALECVDFPMAWSAAESLDSPQIWNRLAQEALQLGKVQMSLDAFTKAQNHPKLSFLSTILGIPCGDSNNCHDFMSTDSQALVQMFEKSNLSVLAHLASAGKTSCDVSNPQLGNFLMRRPSSNPLPNPVNPSSLDWPLLYDPAVKATTSTVPSNAVSQENGWAALENDFNDLDVSDPVIDDQFGAFGDTDLDIPLDEDDLALLGNGLAGEYFDLELPDKLPGSLISNSQYTVTELKEQVMHQNGLVRMSPEMMDAIERTAASQVFLLPALYGCQSLEIPNARVALKFGQETEISAGLQATTQGKFPEALTHFRRFLQLSAVSPIQCDSDELALARNYCTALLIEMRRKVLADSAAPPTALILDLAVLFTRCPLKGEHHLLSLRAALASAYKFGAYKTAAHLARRLLALSVPDSVALQARKVLAVAEKANYAEAIENIKYGAFADDQPWIVDPVDFMRLAPENGGFECQYCHTKYGNSHECCVVCEIGHIANDN
jgi:coatomer subunit alpha